MKFLQVTEINREPYFGGKLTENPILINVASIKIIFEDGDFRIIELDDGRTIQVKETMQELLAKLGKMKLAG